MKWLIRTVVILIAAVVVSVATAWIAPSLMSNSNFPGDRGRFEQRRPSAELDAATDSNNNTNASAPPVRRERGERGGGLFGIGVVLRNLLEVSIVVLPFAIYGVLKQRRRRERHFHLAASQE